MEESIIIDSNSHSNDAFKTLREWMRANKYEHILNCAKEIKGFCEIHKCDECPLFKVDDEGFSDCVIWGSCLPAEWQID